MNIVTLNFAQVQKCKIDSQNPYNKGGSKLKALQVLQHGLRVVPCESEAFFLSFFDDSMTFLLYFCDILAFFHWPPSLLAFTNLKKGKRNNQKEFYGTAAVDSGWHYYI